MLLTPLIFFSLNDVGRTLDSQKDAGRALFKERTHEHEPRDGSHLTPMAFPSVVSAQSPALCLAAGDWYEVRSDTAENTKHPAWNFRQIETSTAPAGNGEWGW